MKIFPVIFLVLLTATGCLDTDGEIQGQSTSDSSIIEAGEITGGVLPVDVIIGAISQLPSPMNGTGCGANEILEWTGTQWDCIPTPTVAGGAATSVPVSGIGPGTIPVGVLLPSNQITGALNPLTQLNGSLCANGEILESDGTNFTCVTPSTVATSVPASGVTAGTLGAGVLIPSTQITGSINPNAQIGAGALNGAVTVATSQLSGTINPATQIGAGNIPTGVNLSAVSQLPAPLNGTGCAVGEMLQRTAGGWACIAIPSGADNLGNHTATTNIQLGSNYLSGDGDNEGIFVAANGKVGIGTNTPFGRFHVVTDSPASSIDDDIALSTFADNSSPAFAAQRARGSLAAPAPVQNDDIIGSLWTSAFNGATFVDTGYVAIRAEEDFSLSVADQDAYMVVNLLENGVRAEKMRVTSSGRLGLGTANPAVELDVDTGVINASAICDENNANCIDLSTGTPPLSVDDLTDGRSLGTSYFIGPNAGANAASGHGTGFGRNALRDNVSGSYNAAFGLDALMATTGGSNTAVGGLALRSNVGGASNVAVGRSALDQATDSSSNTAVGAYALAGITSSSSNNTSIGSSAMRYVNSGTGNVALGGAAGRGIAGTTNANQNVFVGYLSGRDVELADNNTFLGYNTARSIVNGDNNIAIGHNVDFGSDVSSQLNIGNAIYGNLSTGNVGIGTNSPAVELDVDTGVINASAICDENNANCIDLSVGASASAIRSVAVNPGAGNVAGDIVYNTTDGVTYFYSGASWEPMASSGGSNSVVTDANPAVNLPGASAGDIAYNSTSNQLEYYNGSSWGAVSSGGAGDDLGNHTATSNIQLGSNYLSGDGDNEGIFVAANGNVGVGTSSPASSFHVSGSASRFNLDSNSSSGTSTLMTLSRDNDSGVGAPTMGGTLEFSYETGVEGVMRTSAQLTTRATGEIQLNASDNSGALTTRVFVHRLGNIAFGNGQTNPAADLHIYKSTPDIRLGDSDNTSYADLYSDNGNLNIRADDGNTVANSNMTFEVDGAEAVRINSSGNVGIGTTNPAADLHVEGTVRALNNMTIGGAALTGETIDISQSLHFRNPVNDKAEILAEGNGASSGNGLYLTYEHFGAVADQRAAQIYLRRDISNVGSNGAIEFKTNNGTTLNDSMVIKSSGNVGIGTITPVVELDVDMGVINASAICDESNANCIDLSVGASASSVRSVAVNPVVGNVAGDVVYNTTDGVTYIYSGTVWEAMASSGDSNSVVSNANPGVNLPGASAGDIAYNSTSNQLEYYNGSSWGAVSSGGAGDDLGNHTATQNINLNNFRIANVHSGNAGNPAIQFNGDADTGVFSPISNNIGLTTGGIERLRVDALGNVGIGTSSPVQKLDVDVDQNAPTRIRVANNNVGDTASARLQINNDTGAMLFGISSSGYSSSGMNVANYATLRTDSTLDGLNIGTGGAGDPLRLYTANTERLRIDGDGNVGIGEVTPTSRLHVAGDIRTETTADTIYTNNLAIVSSSADMDINYSSADLTIHSDLNDTMTLLRNGNVGIGVVAPTEALDVNGNVKGTQLCIGVDCRAVWPTSNVGTVTSVATGTGLTGGTITGSGTISIAGGGVGTTQLANDAVTSGKILNNTITASDIGPDAINASELSNNSVASANIILDTIVAADIAANAIGASELANDSVGSANVIVNSLTAADLAANSVGASEIATDAVRAAEIQANAVGTSEIANSAVTAAKIAPCANGQILKVSGGVFACAADATGSGADNMGDHSASQNIRLNNRWLSSDGGNEGIRIDSDGDVGIGTGSPAGALDVYSTTSGFLPPRMTEAQRDSIVGPADGSIIYNSTSHKINIVEDGDWQELSSSGSGGQEDLTITNTHNAGSDNGAGTSRTFTSVSIGTAANDRFILAVMTAGWSFGGAPPDVNTLTIGGITATKIFGNSGGHRAASYWLARVPSGTSVSVVANYAASVNFKAMHIYRIRGLQSIEPIMTATSDVNTNNTIRTTSLNVNKGSVAVLGGVAGGCSSAYTWSGGATEDSDIGDGLGSSSVARFSAVDYPEALSVTLTKPTACIYWSVSGVVIK